MDSRPRPQGSAEAVVEDVAAAGIDEFFGDVMVASVDIRFHRFIAIGEDGLFAGTAAGAGGRAEAGDRPREQLGLSWRALM